MLIDEGFLGVEVEGWGTRSGSRHTKSIAAIGLTSPERVEDTPYVVSM